MPIAPSTNDRTSNYVAADGIRHHYLGWGDPSRPPSLKLHATERCVWPWKPGARQMEYPNDVLPALCALSHANPVASELSLRAKRGNLVAGKAILRVTRSTRHCASRDDKLGTREAHGSAIELFRLPPRFTVKMTRLGTTGTNF